MALDFTGILQSMQRGALVSLEWVGELTKNPTRYRAVVNGVLGDTLAEQGSDLAIEMELFDSCQLGERPVRKFYPSLNKKLVILVHGLCDLETVWLNPKDESTTFGTQLQKDLGYHPLYLRYNSGLHISTNGQKLSQLLTDTLAQAKIEIEEIVFIGHSMGGLVVRSACHYGELNKADWVKRVSKVFLLGTPHLGTDLEKVGHLTQVILQTIPNPFTKGLAALGKQRSAGIKDLRFGNLLDEDWQDESKDSWWKDNRHPVPLLPGVDYYILSASLAKQSGNLIADYFGDGLVPIRSAQGKSFRKSKSIPFPPENVKVFSGISHVALPQHARVYARIRAAWPAADSKDTAKK